MRFVVYNIRYGTGAGLMYHFPFPFSGYMRSSQGNLEKITAFLRSTRPDIIGLIEVDSGSYRSGRNNQAQLIANELGFKHVYRSKYPRESLVSYLPMLKQQGNAFLTNQDIKPPTFHYFTEGVKRLVIELEFQRFVIFLVHLSLKFRHRQYQLSQLHSLFTQVQKPMIVAGDFNALWGDRELELFLAATGLRNANTKGLPTFPSIAPRQQFDFILHSPSINITHFETPRVQLSDHLPLICDFEAPGE